MASSQKPVIAVILKGYPRLSETFIAQEILALERRGFRLQLFSLRHPTDPAVHPIHGEIGAPVTYLPEYLKDEPGRVWSAWRQARRLAGYSAALRGFFKDLRRDPTANRLRRFGQACVLAAEMPASIECLYAHFLHTPASVARYGAVLRGLPWSASAHAKDIWTTPDWELREKLGSLDWLVTCTATGCAHLQGLAPKPEKVALVYHGLDFSRFPEPPEAPQQNRDGTAAEEPVRLLSVGRAVEKKGYDVLLAALARLPAELHWVLTHVGGGVNSQQLMGEAEKLGISEKVTWMGPQPHDAVLAQYRWSDLFVLASKIASDGDRDGLPNVLMEAQSQGLACLASGVSAIPELIHNGETGVLVPPEDVAGLAEALLQLIGNPQLRARLGTAGYERVRAHFALESNITTLAGRFGNNQGSLATQ
jgi:glycosyltransferase involved in cell wall biosynthesis